MVSIAHVRVSWPIKVGGRTMTTEPLPAYVIHFGTAVTLIAGIKEPPDGL